ncbi:FAD-dependent oxidoreductase [Conexibacter stalactiti]|uniref:FAD-dependent oxidoreductase n=1 Tax=Conexibacter stalactiti TaxID=1940611 RepID=A0ABU4HS89_9ACTN|nr:FAD-dependent oxidoreductase [Conexibacter stalactiti]MDW5596181.1 FAD-dependent oxidoreductase [Conexibacter stalactiti]MEC5036823.1 FAD-dependent oxidoreductase [Conexibacter stalactiti]
MHGPARQGVATRRPRLRGRARAGYRRTIASPWPHTPPSAADRARYADASTTPYWLDALPPRPPQPPLSGPAATDLCIVGGGFTGLWAALHAKRADPARDVLLLEAATIAWGASGRNGGFVASSLTHGLSNGAERFPDEIELLERLGLENFAGMREDVRAHAIDCGWEEPGELALAQEPHELAWLEEAAAEARRFGHQVELLDAAAVAREVRSPLYLGGLLTRSGAALVDPARLAAGLLDAALAAGVRVHEHSAALGLQRDGGGVRGSRDGDGSGGQLGSAITVTTAGGRVRARKVLLGTSAFPPLLKRLAHYIAPVYDYVLVTEPLSAEQIAAIGWRGRHGLADCANQFHYYRLTADDRILFGGYDAVYRYGGPVSTLQDDAGEETFATLSQHLVTLFPALEGIRFSHRWGGAIDTCSRFFPFFGTAHGGDVSYAVGYTGLGVGATRFGAQVALDLLDGRETEATRTRYVRTKPLPFPPEPLRSAAIQLTRNRLAAADRNGGRRGLWLRTLDRFGLGFDS